MLVHSLLGQFILFTACVCKVHHSRTGLLFFILIIEAQIDICGLQKADDG